MEQNNVKYTTDGKKVVVVGKLNNQETIVQEIFISDGNEIPAGENFVVRSLLDAPSVSWKEKKIKDTENDYNIIVKKHEEEIRKYKIMIRQESATTMATLKALKSVQNNITNESFKTVIDFISGNITHFLETSYNGMRIVDFKKKTKINDDYYRSSLKLASVFGKDDGSLSYRISQYSDGSDSYSTSEVIPFLNYESAHTELKSRLLIKEVINEADIKTAEEYKIILDENKVKDFWDKIKESKERLIVQNKKNIEKLESEISGINKK
jgi:hypothetical protein